MRPHQPRAHGRARASPARCRQHRRTRRRPAAAQAARSPRRAGPSARRWRSAQFEARAPPLGQRGVVRVAGADRRDVRRWPEGVADLLERGQGLARHHREAAGLEQVEGEGRAGAELVGRPRLHRNTRGRSPVRARMASLRSRRRSNASPSRCAGMSAIGPAGRRPGRHRRRPARSAGRELGHPGDRHAARRESLLPLGPGRGDQLLRPAACSAASMPPRRSISWTRAQASLRQLLGQGLDVPGAAGRIDHPAQIALLLQDELGVAGDAPRQRRGRAQRVVERAGR